MITLSMNMCDQRSVRAQICGSLPRELRPTFKLSYSIDLTFTQSMHDKGAVRLFAETFDYTTMVLFIIMVLLFCELSLGLISA